MLHGGRNTNAHKAVLERVQGRLEGWKARCISRAGRLTLAQAVLNSLPFFQMQFEKLSTWLHKELDKVTRKCVWGNTEVAKGIHLINWETLTRTKRLGGANLKAAKLMNWALLAKLAWRVLTSRGELWCEILRSKYGMDEETGHNSRIGAGLPKYGKESFGEWSCSEKDYNGKYTME